jgi:hypothetical protein
MSNQLTLKIRDVSAGAAVPARQASRLLQRQCACGQHAASGQCDGCSKRSLSLQRHTNGLELATPQTSGVPPIVHEVLRSPGQPLDAATRSFMESRFGEDFSQVRVHADPKAADSARAVNASAYTVGAHIAFASRRYAPATAAGRHLIAHELAHTIQQGFSTPDTGRLDIGAPGDSREREADSVADQAVSQQSPPVSVSGTTAGHLMMQRQEGEEASTPGTMESPSDEAPGTTEVPVSPGSGATPLVAPSVPQTFQFTVPTGLRRFRDVFRVPSSGNFSITASGVMSARPSTRASYFIKPITSGFHLNGDDKEYTTGGGPVTNSWTDIAADVDCSLDISTANTNPGNALTGSGSVNP